MTALADMRSIDIPEGRVVSISRDGVTVWRAGRGYVSLGDSIAAGHAINSDWETDFGVRSQFGEGGNTSTALVPGCYTDIVGNDSRLHGILRTTSYAHSGDTVADLMSKLADPRVGRILANADLVTVCIGANDVLEPALMHLQEYIDTGDLSAIEAQIDANLVRLSTDSDANSYRALVDRIAALAPKAQCVYMTIYNPYKYLWLDEGKDGFFKPVLNAIPQITILGFEVDELIKAGLLNTSAIRTLYARVNGLCDWAERYVTALNAIISRKVPPTGLVADVKALFDTVPDRGVSPASYRYNDLVNVEYTRGYDTMTMDWGELYQGDVVGYWTDLATSHVDSGGLDIEGLASQFVADVVERVIVPDIDPHPESTGHILISKAMGDALGWSSLVRYTLSYDANGGGGSVASVTVPSAGDQPAYVSVTSGGFTAPGAGWYSKGWNTRADGSGTSYSAGQLVGLTGDLVLYAMWSNVYTLTYRHTNHTNLYGNDETGHMECYNLYINGTLMPKLGKFSDNQVPVYSVAYGSTIRVVVSSYKQNDILYKDKDCRVYLNGSQVASGNNRAEYTFTLTRNMAVEFHWKIAGSLATFNAQSWEDCYITG